MITPGRPPRTSVANASAATGCGGSFASAVSSEAALRVRHLPWHHSDPFDRLLIAQAQQMPARLLTADSQLPVYSELVELIA